MREGGPLLPVCNWNPGSCLAPVAKAAGLAPLGTIGTNGGPLGCGGWLRERGREREREGGRVRAGEGGRPNMSADQS